MQTRWCIDSVCTTNSTGEKRVDLVMILVYFNLITIYESMGTAKSPLGIESWTGNDVYISMDTCFTEKR